MNGASEHCNSTKSVAVVIRLFDLGLSKLDAPFHSVPVGLMRINQVWKCNGEMPENFCDVIRVIYNKMWIVSWVHCTQALCDLVSSV